LSHVRAFGVENRIQQDSDVSYLVLMPPRKPKNSVKVHLSPLLATLLHRSILWPENTDAEMRTSPLLSSSSSSVDGGVLNNQAWMGVYTTQPFLCLADRRDDKDNDEDDDHSSVSVSTVEDRGYLSFFLVLPASSCTAQAADSFLVTAKSLSQNVNAQRHFIIVEEVLGASVDAEIFSILLAKCLIRFGLQVERCGGGTADRLQAYVATAAAIINKPSYINLDFAQPLKIKSGPTGSENSGLWPMMLAQIPGVGESAAIAISKEAGIQKLSPIAWMRMLDSLARQDAINRIANIRMTALTASGERRIGVAMAQKVITALIGNSSSSSDND
jgi:hypothetical protein